MDPKYDACNPLTWGLHPLFHMHVKLPISALARMTPLPSAPKGFEALAGALRLLSFGTGVSAPIRLVHLAGFVVNVQRFPRQTRFTLDDGSGTVAHFVRFHEEGGGDVNLRLGRFSSALGALEWAYEKPEVRVEKVYFSDDPNVEMLWWADLQRAHHAYQSMTRDFAPPPGASSSGASDIVQPQDRGSPRPK